MSYENLILGVLFSIGIFAVKSGVGLSYLIAVQPQKRTKITALVFFALAYGLVFFAVALLAGIDPLPHLADLQSWMQSGMIVHLVLAVLLILWGWLLLRLGARSCQKSKGRLLLALPCPVCATVIFFSTGFLRACFPDTPKAAMLALYLAFLLINLITIALIGLYRKGRAIPAESWLGRAMLLIALYYLISVIVMPQFADADKVYRLAQYQSSEPAQKTLHLLPFSILGPAAFAGGYGFKFKTIRRIV